VIGKPHFDCVLDIQDDKEELTDPESRKMLNQAGNFAAVGLEMGLAVAIGIFGGRFLDSKLDTEPVFFWIGFSIGIGAAAKAVVVAVQRARKSLGTNGSSSDNEN
jgi:F0F1-type ATP synthase assembly protein I